MKLIIGTLANIKRVCSYFLAFSFLFGLSVACTVNERQTIEAAPTRPTAIYFTIESDALLAPADLHDHGFLVVTTVEQLESALAQHSSVKALYFHPDTLMVVDDIWLRNVHYRGLVIVALNSPLSALAQKLQIELQVGDLPGDRPEGWISGAVIHTQSKPGYHSHHQMADSFADFASIVHTVERLFLIEPE